MKYAKYYISILLLILVPSYISANVSKNKFNKTEVSQNDEEGKKIEKVIDGVHYEIVTDTNGIYANVIGLEEKPVFIKIPEYIKVNKN